jgi:hypothetical protein
MFRYPSDRNKQKSNDEKLDFNGIRFRRKRIGPLYVPETYAYERYRQKLKQYRQRNRVPEIKVRRDWIPIVVSLIGIVVVAAYTVYARRQWIASNDIARGSDIELRAYMLPVKIELAYLNPESGEGKYVLILGNVGKTPASEVIATSSIIAWPDLPETLKCTMMANGSTAAVGSGLTEEIDGDIALRPDEVAAMKTTEPNILHVFGCVTYTDVFSHPHCAQFCFQYSGKFVNGAFSNRFRVCHDHNRECKPEEQ